MAGKKGCSGGYRPGAGRPAGATAIKKTGQAKAKKKKVVDLEPSKASVTFLAAFVVKKRPQRLEPTAAQSVGSAGFEHRAAMPVAAFDRLSSHDLPALTLTSVTSCDCAQSNL